LLSYLFSSVYVVVFFFFFFSSRRRHTRFSRDWSSDVCSSDLTYDLVCIQRRAALDANQIVRLCHSGAPLMTVSRVRFKCFTRSRSEERRVGKECRSWWSTCT